MTTPALVVCEEAATTETTKWLQSVPGLPHKLMDFKNAIAAIESGAHHTLIIATHASELGLQNILEAWILNVGPLPNSVLIVCDDPTPAFTSEAFEYGVDHFCTRANAPITAKRVYEEISRGFSSAAFSHKTIFEAVRAIRRAEQKKIIGFAPALAKLSGYDAAACYTLGRVYEATGNFASAVKFFEKALGLNFYLRPNSTALAECLLVITKTDRAIEILENMEKANDQFAPRKALLSSIYSESNAAEQASAFLEAAKKLAPLHPRTLEAEASIFLAQSDLTKVMECIVNIREAGAYFAAKLNDFGIQLSKEKTGDQALQLYHKAHTIVRPELRYKISLNAALAAFRLARKDEALRLIERCEKEFGGPFEKATKIKQAIKSGQRLAPNKGVAA